MSVSQEKRATAWTSFGVLAWIPLMAACITVACRGDPQDARFEGGKRLMKAQLQEVSENSPAAPKQPFLLLVGENHANVATQKQLAQLLEALLAARSVDAVLIEGTDGPIDTSALRASVRDAGLRGETETRQFWQRELDAGLIAGYEFVHLVHPSVPVYGVEDMPAKFRFATDMEAKSSTHMVQWREESNTRAMAVVHTARDNLKDKLGPRGTAAEQAEQVLADAAAAYAKAGAPFTEAGGQARKLTTENAEFLRRLMMCQQELRDAQPSLQEFVQWVRDYESRRKTLLAKAESLQRGGSLSAAGQRALEEEARQLKALGQKIENYENQHKESLETLAEADERMEKMKDQLKPWADRLEEAYTQFEEAYFRVANLLLSAASGPEEVKDVRWFFLNEVNRLEKEQETLQGKNELRERDTAMVRNALQYLRTREKTHAVLIVGYAHVEGIRDLLAQQGVPFVSGRLPACRDESQPWEIAAWDARRVPQTTFAAEEPLKEETRFRQTQWLMEVPALLQWRNKAPTGTRVLLGYLPEVRLFEDVGAKRDCAILCLSEQPNLNADRPAYVRDLLPDPANPKGYLLIIDRQAAMKEVDSLNGEGCVFAYVFPKVISGQDTAQWQVYCRGRTIPAGQFRADEIRTSDGAVPKQLVLVEEIENPALRRTLQGGGDSGKPPARGTLSFAHDPQRARKHLALLGQQRKSSAQDVLIVAETELNQMGQTLHFTTRDGENAHAVIFLATNTREFREKVGRLAKAGLLKHKQIGLLVCGDAFAETASLSEELLAAGCEIVWAPGERIRAEDAPQIQKRLTEYIDKLRKEDPAGLLPRVDILMEGMFRYWKDLEPQAPSRIMPSSASVVRDTPRGWNVRKMTAGES